MKKILLTIIASNMVMTLNMISQTGTSGLSFLKLGVSGRALGVGDAYTAIASGPSATYYNPAGLTLSSNPQILLMYKEWIQEMRTEFLGASVPFGNFAFGLSINTTSIENIPLRTKPGEPLGTFTARNAAIGLSGAYQFKDALSFGITGKFLYEKIHTEEASGYAFDLGGLYRSPWDIQIGISLNNLGSMNHLQNESSELPKSIRIGGAYTMPVESMELNITFTSDLVSYLIEKNIHMHVGTEFDYRNLLAIRFGYQTGYEAKNISAGVGIHHGMFYIDYAFIPFRYQIGTTHTISININFN